MTSSNGNIFRVTGHLCGEFHRSPVNSPHKGQWRGALMVSLIWVWRNDWVNNREAGDLRRCRAHYDVIVMLHDPVIAVRWRNITSLDHTGSMVISIGLYLLNAIFVPAHSGCINLISHVWNTRQNNTYNTSIYRTCLMVAYANVKLITRQATVPIRE